MALLSQAYALARAPVTPPGLQPLNRALVFQRVIDLAGAGQRVSLYEPLNTVARDLALDLLGNSGSPSGPDAPFDAEDVRAFDTLLRNSARGAALMAVLGEIFATDAQALGPLSFQAAFAAQSASRPPHLSIVTGGDGGPAPVSLEPVRSPRPAVGHDHPGREYSA